MNLKFYKLIKTNWLRTLPTATLIISLGLTIWMGLFLYEYFYKTIAQIKMVTILRSQVSLNEINKPLYEKIKFAIIEKKKFDPESTKNTRDYFQSLPKQITE